jgi:hypothetical protein
MKKTLAVGVLALASGMMLAGCNLPSNKVTSSPGTTLLAAADLGREVASTSLLVSGGGTSAVKNAKSTDAPTSADRGEASSGGMSSAEPSTSATGDTAAPITMDPSDPSSTLASFDELAVGDYTLKTAAVTSDRSAYASEETLTYVLPNGAAKEVTLYFGTPATEAASSLADSSASSSEATSGPVDEKAKNDGPFASAYDTALHGYGYGSGAFAGMLRGNYGFMDFGKAQGDLSVTYTRTLGLAVTSDNECDFVSEEITAVTSQKTYNLYSFALLVSAKSFVAAEEAYVTNGADTASVYAYAAVSNGTATRFLLQATSAATRLAYLDSTEKIAINRFAEEGNTYYSLHLKEKGAMALVGVYEKVVTTSSAGVATVTYVKVDYVKDKISVPSEN